MSSLKEYLNVLEEETAQTMEQEQIGNREEAFTHYVLSQIATKVSAENYTVCHASIKNSAGNFLGKRKGVFPDIIQKVNGDVLYTLRSLALG